MDTYIAYFDETGDDGITTKSSFEFVLSSIYMPSEKWQENYDAFKTFRKQIRSLYGLYVNEEMHTMDFLRNRDPYRNFNWSLEEKREILISFAKAISSLDIKAVNVIIDKTNIKNEDYSVLEKAVTYNIQNIENDSNGDWKYIIISDKGRISRMRETARKIRTLKYASTYDDCSSNLPINNLIEDIMEKDSKECFFIQICDYISCFIFLYYRNIMKKTILPKRIGFLIDEEFVTNIIKIFKKGEILNTNAATDNEYGIAVFPKAR